MIRAKRVSFSSSKENLDRLFFCNQESARVWNECLGLAKTYHQTHQKWITQAALQQQTKRRFALHSQSIQAVFENYLSAREATRRAIQKEIRTARYPYKTKQTYPTKWKKDGFRLFPNGKIVLSMGIHNGKRQKPIVLHVSRLPSGEIREIEFCYDHEPYLAVAYEDRVANKPYSPQQEGGVDLGEIHTLAAFAENGQATIITGRKIRSIHRFRNKKLAELSRLQSKCKKGSRQWKKYHRAKRYIQSKSAKQMQDALHKTTKQFVDWCIEQCISDVYVGNPEGVQRNTRKKKKTNKRQAQKLSNWSFAQVKKYLTYKLIQQGIKLSSINEAYTSQTCPVCQKRKKVSSRNYRCPCGYQEHRDIHGARNILSKAKYGEMLHFDVRTQMKYLRIA